MRFLKITIAYDGTNYVGWQIQSNGVSIQEILEKAWTKATQEETRITASGRTDAGVHALGQVCSVATKSKLDEATLCRALNSFLPVEIVVISVHSAPQDFHAISDAKSKMYRYEIQSGWPRDLFRRRYSWRIKYPLDTEAMQKAANILVGTHDFASFQSKGAKTLTTVRTISRLEIIATPIRDELSTSVPATEGHGVGKQILIEIEANGFLYNMVRTITGTLVRVGSRTRSIDWVSQVLKAKNRSAAGPTAPALGLFLVRVDY